MPHFVFGLSSLGSPRAAPIRARVRARLLLPRNRSRQKEPARQRPRAWAQHGETSLVHVNLRHVHKPGRVGVQQLLRAPAKSTSQNKKQHTLITQTQQYLYKSVDRVHV